MPYPEFSGLSTEQKNKINKILAEASEQSKKTDENVSQALWNFYSDVLGPIATNLGIIIPKEKAKKQDYHVDIITEEFKKPGVFEKYLNRINPQTVFNSYDTAILGSNLTQKPGGKFIPVDLRQIAPNTHRSPHHWVAVGDAHGNALKLLHIAHLCGMVKFPEPAAANYQFFYSVYNMKKDDWAKLTDEEAKALLAEVNKLIDALVISDDVYLRLIGDVLCDRGTNDYFTLKLLNKFMEKNKNIEIILSNHDAEFFMRHHDKDKVSNDDGKYTGKYADANYKRFPDDGNQQTSLLNMHYFLERGLIKQAEVDKLCAPYVAKIKLLSYDKAGQDSFMVHAHAPVNVKMILMGALVLVDEQNNNSFTRGWIDDNDRKIVLDIINKINQKHPITHGDLIKIIDVLNKAVNVALSKGQLDNFLKLKLQSPNDMIPKDKSDFFEKLNKEFSMDWFFENRDNPISLPTDDLIVDTSECKITCVHGHVTSKSNKHFDNCVNVDTDLGRGVGDNLGALPVTDTKPYTPDEIAQFHQKSMETRPKIVANTKKN